MDEQKKSGNGKKWAVGALLLGIGGYIAGILTAPKSGKETRKDIADNANRVVSEAEKRLKVMHSEMNVVIEDTKQLLQGKTGKAKEDLQKAVHVAKDKQGKVKEMLTALRDGGTSDDPNLQKALKEAGKALDELKKFLKR
jgi:gas vesicle protein